jgi:RHS repeat-associated protein
MKYTGHERDAATALDYMHARHYNFGVGRFISTGATNLQNPASTHDPTIPQAWNRYAYVRNRPSLAADPTGRDIWLTYRLPAGLFDYGHIVLQVVDHNSGELRATWSFGPSSGLPPLAKYGAAIFGISMPGEQTPDYLATHHNTRTAVAVTDVATDTELAHTITDRIAANESYNYYLDNCATSAAQLINSVTPFDLPLAEVTPGSVFEAFSNMVYWSSPANAGAQALVDQAYGPGPWLLSDPGVFTDALGNPMNDPDPR